MRLIVFAALVLIAASTPAESMMQATQQTPGTSRPRQTTLYALRDRYRPLLLFAPNSKDARLLRQAELIASDAAALHDRQVPVVPLIGAQRETLNRYLQALDHADLSIEDAAEARRRFHVAAGDFTVILIGKDGGEKFRSRTPVTMERLNAVIDAMPMRQQEVRNGDSK